MRSRPTYPRLAKYAVFDSVRKIRMGLNLIPVRQNAVTIGAMNRSDEPPEEGTENEDAAAAAETPHVLALSDDALRRLAAAQLVQHLDMGTLLVARCQALAQVARGDRLGPLAAAARLMRANAQVAQTLAHVAMVERRQRTIVERIQQPVPRIGELNSKNLSEREVAWNRLKFWRRMQDHVQEAVQVRMGEIDGPDRITMIVKHEEEKFARFEKDGGG